MFFQIRSHAEALNSIATALPEIWRCARPALNHIPIQRRQGRNDGSLTKSTF